MNHSNGSHDNRIKATNAHHQITIKYNKIHELNKEHHKQLNSQRLIRTETKFRATCN